MLLLVIGFVAGCGDYSEEDQDPVPSRISASGQDLPPALDRTRDPDSERVTATILTATGTPWPTPTCAPSTATAPEATPLVYIHDDDPCVRPVGVSLGGGGGQDLLSFPGFSKGGAVQVRLQGTVSDPVMATFSPDGKTAVMAAWAESILWEAETGRLLQVLLDTTTRPPFSPDGTRLATGVDGPAIQLWDVAGNELAVLEGHEAGVTWAAFSPDGGWVVTASGDGTTWLWPTYLSLDSKLDVARQRLSRPFTPEECQRFFRDDPDSCPQTLEALFALFDDEGS